MSLFGKREPTLTRIGREISEAFLTLDAPGRAQALDVIACIIGGVSGLGKLPAGIGKGLWSGVLNAVMLTSTGHKPAEMIADFRAQLCPELGAVLERFRL